MKKFMEYVQILNVEKVSRLLEKGLDPNFHDPDSGGEWSPSPRKGFREGEEGQEPVGRDNRKGGC